LTFPAAGVAQAALKHAIERSVAGTRVYEVTSSTDEFINKATAHFYAKKKDVLKGIGFPTCCSLNGLVGHVAPMPDHKVVIEDGDLVKIDLGVHIDGYLAVVAHTFVVGATAENPATGKKADLVIAAHKAAQLAGRLIATSSSSSITEALAAVAADFKVTPVLGVLSHNISRFLIDGENVILNAAGPEHKGTDFTATPGQVFALDVVLSSGDGKPCRSDERTTIYKRTAATPSLKLNAARHLRGEADKLHKHFPFSLNAIQVRNSLLGVGECERSGVLEPFPVLSEKRDHLVAQTKLTVLIMPNGMPRIITGLHVDEAAYKSEFKVTSNEFKAALMTKADGKAPKVKAEKAAAAAAAAAPEATA
jgi:curved DNA binding protein